MEEFELAIVGGGIVGCCLFSQAVLEGINVVLLEKGDDVASYASKANSGIVHSGYDPKPGSKMAKFNVLGNKMFKPMCKRLGEKFVECGTLTVGRKQDREKLEQLLRQGLENGVPGLRIVERDELFLMEPNLNPEIDCALFAPTGAVVSPFAVCIGLVEEGIINGGKVFTNFEVVKAQTENEAICEEFLFFDSNTESNGYVLTANDGRQVFAKYVVNCTGPNASDINKLFKTKTFNMNYVKGEYILLDKSSQGFVNHPIFPLPTEKGKGILANISVYGNVLLGPTAVPCKKNDTTPQLKGVEEIQENVLKSINSPNFKKTIKLFAGVRVKTGDDFVVERDDKNKNYYYAVGICSPGLTAAPAIAKQFLDWLKQDGIKTKPISLKKRTPYICTRELSKDELKELVKQNPSYGKVVCHCESVSEGEIVDALNSPLKPQTIAAIKRRVSPTMGRCQGRNCIPKIIKIWAEQKRKDRSKKL